MKPAAFAYAAPGELGEVLELLAQHGADAKPLAGGQSLLPMMNLRLAQPAVLVDVNRVAALAGTRAAAGTLAIGATARQAHVERAHGGDVPLLRLALHHVGHVATRARGTIAGSLVHADPAAEMPATLVTLDGEVVAASTRGRRTIPGREFQLSTFTTALHEDELVVEVRLPIRPQAGHGFCEIARRHGDFALIGAAAEVELDDDGRFDRVALTMLGAADVPLRLTAIEAQLRGRRPDEPQLLAELRDAVSDAVDPAPDVHASAAYRKRVAGVAARRAIAQALAHHAAGAAA